MGKLYGITVREMLQSKYFSKCKVLAGGNGLERKIQAATVFDAPDGYKWFRGKEFVVTTGYMFKNNEFLFKEVILYLHKNNSAALGIKVNRFLKTIPENLIKLCNEIGFPIISLPENEPWIDIINAVNSVAMDKYILRINKTTRQAAGVSNYQYSHKKIREIIQELSQELNETVLLYDLLEDKVYQTFVKTTIHTFNHPYNELWNPSFSHTKEIICDQLKICRIINLEETAIWLNIPIYVRDKIVAYLVVWESSEKTDYYDLFLIKLSYTLLSILYEQIYLMNSIEGKFQDEFLQQIIRRDSNNEEQIYKKAYNLQLDVEKQYVCICIVQLNQIIHLYEWREKICERIYQIFSKNKAVFGLLDKNRIVVLYGMDKNYTEKQQEEIKGKCEKFVQYIE